MIPSGPRLRPAIGATIYGNLPSRSLPTAREHHLDALAKTIRDRRERGSTHVGATVVGRYSPSRPPALVITLPPGFSERVECQRDADGTWGFVHLGDRIAGADQLDQAADAVITYLESR